MRDSEGTSRHAIVVMGPSGVGKTTVAQMLAERLDWTFAEADEFHPKANIDKMSAGIPLTDEDRWPWLDLLRDWMTDHATRGESTVVTCSALKKVYRDKLRESGARVRFLELVATRELVMSRLPKRQGHYMPVSLLDSQFETLEPLTEDEDGVKVSVESDPEQIVDEALSALRLTAPPSAARAVGL